MGYFHRKNFRLIKQVALLTVIGALMFMGQALNAQEQSARNINTLNLTAKLNNDGTLNIEQIIEMVEPDVLEWTLFTNSRDLSIKSDERVLKKDEYKIRSKGTKTFIRTNEKALRWQIAYQATTTLVRHDKSNQVFLKIVQESGYVISEMRATFRLSKMISGKNENNLYGNVYAIGGAYNARSLVTSDNEIVYVANLVGPKAYVTISANWPHDMFELNIIQEARLFLINLEIIPYLALGLFLPLVSLLVLLRLRLKQKKIEASQKIDTVLTNPPSHYSPLLAAVLLDKKIYPNAIAAMIIDLCQRGYLVIIKKTGRYYLGKSSKFDEGLSEWERQLLEEIFPESLQKTDPDRIEITSKQNLFSPRVRRAYEEIYRTITSMGFFKESPHFTRIKYKLVALLLHFVSFLGTLWVVIFEQSPYLLIPLAATMMVSFLIIRLTPQLATYTQRGLEERSRWVAFREFLGNTKEKLGVKELQSNLYQQNLSYAVALSKIDEWSKLFEKASIAPTKPSWFIAYEERDIGSFTKEVVEFTSTISSALAQMHGPLVG